MLFLPLGFAASLGFTKKDWERIGYLFIILVVGGTLWSMAHYFYHAEAIQKEYLQSRILRVPLKNDHVRFSWMISVAILLAARNGFLKSGTARILSWIFFITAIWLIVFLHILAARTGLLSFYLMLLITAIWVIVKKIPARYTVILLLSVIVLPLIAYYALPTFHNRVKYILYDLPYFKEAHYLPGTNDAVRVISIKAGWSVLNEYPASGVGFGDVLDETKAWYASHYPPMTETDKIYPSSEWLVYGAGVWLDRTDPFYHCHDHPVPQKKERRQPALVAVECHSGSHHAFRYRPGSAIRRFYLFFTVLWWWKWLEVE